MINWKIIRQVADRRSDFREPVDLYCWADLGGGQSGVDCKVLDISDGGARILPLEETSLPDTFALQIDGNDTPIVAHVVWREAGEIGVAFEDRNPV